MNMKLILIGVIFLAAAHYRIAQTNASEYAYLSFIPIETACPPRYTIVLTEGKGDTARVLCGTGMDSMTGACPSVTRFDDVHKLCVGWVEGELQMPTTTTTPPAIVQWSCSFWQKLFGNCQQLAIMPGISTTTTSATGTTLEGCNLVQRQCYGSQCFMTCRDSYYDFNRDCCVKTRPANTQTYNEIQFNPTSTTLPQRRIDQITSWFANLFSGLKW